ncbi:MAG: hypothetical protein V3U33_00360 [candidate division NC10 bacterium]
MPQFRNIRIKKPGGGTRIQRAQVLKSGKLKFVKNVKRGGKKAAKKSPARKRAVKKAPARKRSKSVAKKGNPNNKSPKIGASIQAFKGTQALLAPVIQSAAASTTTDQFTSELRSKGNLDYAGSLAIEGVNQAIDRKSAHATALSGGSITAWAAETVAAVRAFDAAKGKGTRGAAVAANQSLSLSYRAYNPVNGKIDLAHSNFREYQGLKLVGALARRLSNTGPFRKIASPFKRMIGSLGGRL